MSECIPIIGGTGALGYGLALRLAAAGNEVVVGSRDATRAAEAAERVVAAVPGAVASGFENSEAARRGPVVLLTVPFAAQADTLKGLAGTLSEGQLLVDCTVPLAAAVGGRPVRTLGVWQGSAAEQAQELAPDGVIVVSAFHTASAAVLADGGRLEEDVLICGDRKADKRRVASLVEQIEGLRAVNAGSLETSRIVESLTPLLISINGRYKTHTGLKIMGLPERRHW